MFIPSAFAEADPRKLHSFIEQHSFGLVVSQVGGEPFATHIPILLDRDAGPHGTLIGHFARANPQWVEITGQSVLAVFSGPHAYISPTWYEAVDTVPTWNYAAVHAYGRVEVIEDRAALLEIVARTVRTYESAEARPWTLDADSLYVDRLLGAIVGFRMVVNRLEGKWKMNQNHPAERREKVVRGLLAHGGEDAVATAEMVRATIPPPGSGEGGA
ncbi:FMN-binding negative transcriptional regulator [Fimbriiglobus ruber]|uniref:Transcriptional regulator n=1 Tax=Fimbriiglobus ruber TaxID=1908690 RepID=A0A225DJI7_9BACT|nr:FMN-binding negative transcriptional regulator [Fimbriiglobus ruber]OWK36297.1 Transcriptional regulator [Fimbriiglobus ruber]